MTAGIMRARREVADLLPALKRNMLTRFQSHFLELEDLAGGGLVLPHIADAVVYQQPLRLWRGRAQLACQDDGVAKVDLARRYFKLADDNPRCSFRPQHA